MTYDSQKHHRRSIRLTGYDYSQAGAYFVTVCAQDRACLFGEMVDGEMRLNDVGRMVSAEWDALPIRFPAVELDEFIVMPNHVHGILTISTASPNANVGAAVTGPGAGTRPAPTGTGSEHAPRLGDVVGAFKSLTMGLYIQGVKQSGWPPFRGRLWQRNYHEHIIRNDRALNLTRQYILDNPANWASDEENPAAGRPQKTA